MSSLYEKIEAAIKNDAPSNIFSIETILSFFSTAYGAAVRLRNAAFAHNIFSTHELDCPVISIGNVTMGGTGKTPMTLYVAQLVETLGYRSVIISRGYKGALEKQGGVVHNGKKIIVSSDESGDEPFMIAQILETVPVVVGQNRFKSGLTATAAFSPDIIILDDGFQHIKLKRDINILLVDHHRPFGNGHLFPRGPLREPISALNRADIIIETRCEPSQAPSPALLSALKHYTHEKSVFQCRSTPFLADIFPAGHRMPKNPPPSPSACELPSLKGKRVFAFSGLADNHNFIQTLAGLECHVVGKAQFPDHHRFDTADLSTIKQAACDTAAEVIVTTQKDICRISNPISWPLDLITLGIRHDFGKQTSAFYQELKARLYELNGKNAPKV